MQNEYLVTAMMLLEMAGDKTEPPLADDNDLIWAAHGYVQAAMHSAEPGEFERELLAKIRTAVALEDAMRKPAKEE